MLRPLRQTEQVNIDFITPWTQERGGALTYAVASGMQIVEYAFQPSGAFFAGIQLNDVEYVNMGRQPFPQLWRDVEQPCGIVGIGVQGDWITDWVHIVGTVQNGDTAYVGPSGTFTNSAAYGGAVCGKFIGPLKAQPHFVTMRGLGFSRELIDPCTKELTTENSAADRVRVPSDGFIKIRITRGGV